MKGREPRFRVVLPARIRWDGGWQTASIRNISAHGLLLCAPKVPPVGAFVELLVGAETIVARAVWSDEHTCGLRARSPLNFDRLRQKPGQLDRRQVDSSFTVSPDRRRPIEAYGTAEKSRTASYFLQYVMVLVVALVLAGTIGWEVYRTLSTPFSAISNAITAFK